MLGMEKRNLLQLKCFIRNENKLHNVAKDKNLAFQV